MTGHEPLYRYQMQTEFWPSKFFMESKSVFGCIDAPLWIAAGSMKQQSSSLDGRRFVVQTETFRDTQ